MAALINKRTTDSRYVSVFADSTPDVDITFMIPFLARPSDHYLVGVDNLTISLSALGLLVIIAMLFKYLAQPESTTTTAK